MQPANIIEQANRPAPVAARLESTAIRIHPSHSQECYSGGEEKADNVKLLLQTEEKSGDFNNRDRSKALPCSDSNRKKSAIKALLSSDMLTEVIPGKIPETGFVPFPRCSPQKTHQAMFSVPQKKTHQPTQLQSSHCRKA